MEATLLMKQRMSCVSLTLNKQRLYIWQCQAIRLAFVTLCEQPEINIASRHTYQSSEMRWHSYSVIRYQKYVGTYIRQIADHTSAESSHAHLDYLYDISADPAGDTM